VPPILTNWRGRGREARRFQAGIPLQSPRGRSASFGNTPKAQALMRTPPREQTRNIDRAAALDGASGARNARSWPSQAKAC
jgi:hypothetical protein